MDPRKLLFGPDASEMAGSGGGSPAPDPTPTSEPTIDSTAGLSGEELSSRPSLDGGGDPSQPQSGGQTPAPTDPNVPGGPNSSAPAGTSPSIREAARYYGLDLNQYEDDGQAFAALIQMAQRSREADYYSQLGRQIAPHYEGVQQYLATQQARNQPSEERQPWEAPEFDERWLGLVDKDPNTGQYVAKPGINPIFAERVQAYVDHIDRWTTQIARNPMEALGPLIDARASQLLEQRFGQQQAVSEAQGIIESNAPWIYAVDANGRRQVGHDGKYVPTPLGARYYSHLQQLRQSGVTDARSLDALAKQLLQGEIYASQAQAGQAASPQSTAAQGRPNVNQGQAVQPTRRNAVPAATDPEMAGLSLSERLRAEMAREGVTDADFQLQ